MDKEGSALAPFFTARGYTLFVMTYRMPGDGHEEASNAPLADAQRAIRYIRANAQQWKIDPLRLGVLGFSSGGTLPPAWEPALQSRCMRRWIALMNSPLALLSWRWFIR